MKKTKKQPKIEVYVKSIKKTGKIISKYLKDLKTEEVKDVVPGCSDFCSLADMKESLNWCYNGDPALYRVSWFPGGQPGVSYGIAYIYD